MIIDLNINGVLFHVEESAASDLKAYINAIRKYFSNYENNYEIIADIENRIAEFLLVKLTKQNEVIGCEEVNALIDSMGEIEGFESESLIKFKEYDTSAPLPKKLYRDEKRKLIGGVASGIAYYLGIDPLFIRLLFLLSFLNYFDFFSITGGVTATYIILWLAIPGSFKLRENIKVKNFYRDGIDKVLGGVSGGVGAYFGIETNVIRVLFVVGLFLGGFSIVLYLIFWVITPEAVSLTQRMQMKGEKITLENIEQRISSTLNIKKGDKEKFFEKVSSVLDHRNYKFDLGKIGESLKIDKSSNEKVLIFFNRLWSGVKNYTMTSINAVKNNFHYFTNALKYFSQAVSGLSLFAIALALSAVLFLILEAFLGFVQFEWMQYLSYDYFIIPIEIARQTVPPTTSIFSVLMLWIPVFYIGIYGVTLVIRKKILNSYINWTLLGIWIFSLIGTASTIPLLFQNFNTAGTFVNNAKFEIPSSTLKIDLLHQNDYPTFRDVKVTLKGHRGKDIELVEKFHARGKTRQEAVENAKRIMYSVSLDDSLLKFSNSFGIDSGVPFRSQEVQLELRIPYYKEFIMTESLGRILLHTLYPKGYSISQLGENNKWVYTEDGLNCLTCEEDYIAHKENPNNYHDYEKLNILVKEFDQKDFYRVKVKGAFDVEIMKSNEFKIIAEGEGETLRKAKVWDKEGTLLIIDKESLIWKEGKSHVNFKIYTPSLEEIYLFGPIQAQVSGFEQKELKLFMEGMVDCNFECDIKNLEVLVKEKACTLNMVGKGDYLEIDVDGDSEVNAFEYYANNVLVSTQKTSLAKVYASKTLKMKSINQSKVKHKGNPEVKNLEE